MLISGDMEKPYVRVSEVFRNTSIIAFNNIFKEIIVTENVNLKAQLKKKICRNIFEYK